ncbi:MAG: hypothetical protein Q9161_008414 [Pseudevernia consocians]
MGPDSYQANIAGQGGADNSSRFGFAPSKHDQHLAKNAPVGRFDGTPSASSPSNTYISPYDSTYTATTRPVASPSVGAGPPAVTPALSIGKDSTASSPSRSTSRSPSPDAAELISSLANYETLSDDALYEATLNAQQAMVKWQNQYMALQNEISRMKESPYHSENRKANPRKLEDPEEYDRKHHDSLQQLTPNMTQTTGTNPPKTARPRPTNPITMPAPKGRGPRNELHIDMTEPMQPVQGKRIRKPRVLDDDNPAVTTRKNSSKRPREPNDKDTTNAPATDQPPAKKQRSRARSITPPDWIHTARDVRSETGAPAAAPEDAAPKKRQGPAKVPSEVVVKNEPVEEEMRGKDPVRAAAARLVWARRRAEGTNGRHGGVPRGGTVARGRVEGEGEREGK